MKYKHYEELATAILIQAYRDFKKAENELEEHPDFLLPQKTVRELEIFFRSDWFKKLAQIAGDLINFKMDNIEKYEKEKDIHDGDSGQI